LRCVSILHCFPLLVALIMLIRIMHFPAILFATFVFLSPETVRSNMCKDVYDKKTTDDTKTDVDYYENIFAGETLYHGNRGWNELVLECNRKRDTKGDELVKIMTRNDYENIKKTLDDPNLNPVAVKGAYNYYGTVFTQQKYRYLLSKESGVWKMILPYIAEINEAVNDRVDFYMGTLSVSSPDFTPYDKGNHAWKLYEGSQYDEVSGNLVSGAKPIAETLCSTAIFKSGKEDKYNGKNNEKSYKRDRKNKHIVLGRIQYSYRKKISWQNGCRVDKDIDLYWKDASGTVHKYKPSDWIYENFIRVSEEYWSTPNNFELKILLKKD